MEVTEFTRLLRQAKTAAAATGQTLEPSTLTRATWPVAPGA